MIDYDTFTSILPQFDLSLYPLEDISAAIAVANELVGALSDIAVSYAVAHMLVMNRSTPRASMDGGIGEVQSTSLQDAKTTFKGMSRTQQDVFWVQTQWGRTYLALSRASAVRLPSY